MKLHRLPSLQPPSDPQNLHVVVDGDPCIILTAGVVLAEVSFVPASELLASINDSSSASKHSLKLHTATIVGLESTSNMALA